MASRTICSTSAGVLGSRASPPAAETPASRKTQGMKRTSDFNTAVLQESAANLSNYCADRLCRFVMRILRPGLEVADQPLARFGLQPALARGVVLHLVEVDGPDGEILRIRMRKV